MITRRDLLRNGAAFAGLLAANVTGSSSPIQPHPARYWHKMGEAVACDLCPNACILPHGKTGICRTRQNRRGELFTHGYANPCAIHVDPVEKKPLYHMLPGSRTFSLGIAGCNLRCKNCQNYTISQKSPLETQNTPMSPEKAVQEAQRLGCQIIAYTYTEPTVWIEYVIDTAKIARKAGLRNVLVSSGYINPAPFIEMAAYIDGAHIDVKSFSEATYRDLNAGKLAPVLKTLQGAQRAGVWLEIVNLIVPKWSDNMDVIRAMCKWIARNLGSDVPLHFSRFFPMHRLGNLYPTPLETLHEAREIALEERLSYVYIGNVPGVDTSTWCHSCGEMVVERDGYKILNQAMSAGACVHCGNRIPGVWDA